MNGFATGGPVKQAWPRVAGPRAVDHDGTLNRPLRDVTQLVDVTIADPLVDRWAAFRDRWSALTFYLFDPQSWRR
jgi:hypothetical protein